MANLAESKKLREQRAELVEANRNTLAQISDCTDAARVKELETEWDKRDGDITALTKAIDRAERQEQLEREDNAPARERRSGREAPPSDVSPEQREQQFATAFNAYMRHGREGMSPEQRAVLEQRAQTVTTTGGGYLIPEGFVRQIDDALLDYSGTMSAPTTKMYTTDGADLPMPTCNDTSNKGQLLGINTQESEQALTFGVVTFQAYKFTSKNVLVPVELLQDAAFNLDSYLAGKLGERLGRILEQYNTTGTGTSQPNGIVTAATAGVTGSSASTLSTDDLIDLQHSVDPAYRRSGSAGFMFNDSTLKVIKKLKDSQNRPLWLPGYDVREADTILGHRYYINQEMAAVGASAKSVLFGDLSKYVIRIAKGMTMMRLVERYADYYQVGFQAWMRADADLVDAGTHPIKYLIHQSA